MEIEAARIMELAEEGAEPIVDEKKGEQGSPVEEKRIGSIEEKKEEKKKEGKEGQQALTIRLGKDDEGNLLSRFNSLKEVGNRTSKEVLEHLLELA